MVRESSTIPIKSTQRHEKTNESMRLSTASYDAEAYLTYDDRRRADSEKSET